MTIVGPRVCGVGCWVMSFSHLWENAHMQLLQVQTRCSMEHIDGRSDPTNLIKA